MALIQLLFTMLCCYVLYKLSKRLLLMYRQRQLLEKLSGPPSENIILGNTSVMKLTPEELPTWIAQQYKKFGGIFKLWFALYPYVIIADAEYAEVYFTDKKLTAKSDAYFVLHVWLGLGLLTSQGQLWQQRRKLITPAFHFSILNSFIDIFVNNALNLIEKLRECDGTPADVFELMHLVSLDNICETAMGIKIDALKNPKGEYIQAIEETAHIVVERALRPYYWNDFIYFLTPVGRRLKRSLDIIFELSTKVTSDKKKERALRKKENDRATTTEEFEGKKKLAFLDLLLEASESQSVPLSDKDLRDEVNTFMFEGHDTTATSMSFTLYLLSLHPEIQEKCYQELNDIFQGSDRKPNAEDLRKMNYLEQVIKESLRLFPSVPMMSRKVVEETKLGKYTLPEGATFVLHLYNLHRDEKYFPDPEKFDPDRFTPEKCASRHPYAFVPFAAGPRNCIGQKFAMMEEKVVLSYILRNFILESVHGKEKLQLLFALVIRSQKSLQVKFKPRKTRHISSNKSQ